MSKKMNRRNFLKVATLGTAGVALSSCSPKVEKVIETVIVEKPAEQVIQTVVVEKAGEKVIETVVVEKPAEKVVQTVIKEVTPTPVPVVQEKIEDIQGVFPRRETVIARQLTGRVGTPDNMNLWVGWKWQDRGLQNLADEPFWSVDFATGNIINGLADGDAKYNTEFT
jgi:hypothetical protein